jgi:hypothetical protein
MAFRVLFRFVSTRGYCRCAFRVKMRLYSQCTRSTCTCRHHASTSYKDYFEPYPHASSRFRPSFPIQHPTPLFGIYSRLMTYVGAQLKY